MELWHTPEAYDWFHFQPPEENILLFAQQGRFTSGAAFGLCSFLSPTASYLVVVTQGHKDERDDKNAQLKIYTSI